MNDMVDMSQFVEAKSDQLNADDLIGAPRTITIRRVTGNDGDQPVSIYYEGDNNKPYKPCKTMRRVLLGVWGRNGADYVGRSMRIYRDDNVTFGGLNVGGVRISHMSHIEKKTVVVVMKTKGKKAGIEILPLQQERPQQQQQDATADWARRYIAHVEATCDRVELEQAVENQAEKLVRLKDARPELHAECEAAIQRQRELFAPEGKPDSERGEDFADDGGAF